MQIEEAIKLLEEFKRNGYSMLYIKYGDRNKANLKIEKAIEALTNYIETMQSEFDRLEGIEDNTAMLKMELEKKDRQIEASNQEHRYDVEMIDEVKGEAVKLYKEIREKDKVIDLMAEYIHNTSNGEIYDIVCKEECENRNCIFAIGDNKEQEIDCIKQYFYKKAEEK